MEATPRQQQPGTNTDNKIPCSPKSDILERRIGTPTQPVQNDKGSAMPDVYVFTDYRDFLKAFHDEQRAKNRAFSFRNFSRMAGLKSPSYLNMVIKGDRNLTAGTIAQFSKALRFNKKQSQYFEAMVFFNQAKTEKERDYYLERLVGLRPKVKLKGIEKDQYEFYRKKYFVTIHQMVLLPGFKEDPDWIANHVSPKISAKEAQYAIDVLLRLKLLTRDENGKLTTGEGALTTPAQVSSLDIKNFHRSMLSDAKEALFDIDWTRRNFTSLTIPVPLKSMPELKKRIQNFREEILDWIAKGEIDYHDVYQMNIQLFPTTDSTESNRKKSK